MQRLCRGRVFCCVSVRASFRHVSQQVRAFQPALRFAPQESPLPDFTYRALLVDAAGTLLVPSEPAAEVCASAAQRDPCGCPSTSSNVHSSHWVAGLSSIWQEIRRQPIYRRDLVTLSQVKLKAAHNCPDPADYGSRWSKPIECRSYNSPWTLTPQRYVGDGRPFW